MYFFTAVPKGTVSWTTAGDQALLWKGTSVTQYPPQQAAPGTGTAAPTQHGMSEWNAFPGDHDSSTVQDAAKPGAPD